MIDFVKKPGVIEYKGGEIKIPDGELLPFTGIPEEKAERSVQKHVSEAFRHLEEAAVKYLRALNSPILKEEEIEAMNIAFRAKYAGYMQGNRILFVDPEDLEASLDSFLNGIAKKHHIRRDKPDLGLE